MSNWKGKTRGGILGYKIFVFIIKYLGVRSAYALLAFVAIYFIPFAIKSTKSIYAFFRLRFNKNPIAALWATYRTYFSFGQALIDRTAILAGLGDKFTFFFDGEHHLKKMAFDKKGGVLISAHAGNWAIAGSILDDNLPEDMKVNVVMLADEHERIQSFLDKTQKKQSANIIGISNDMSHIIKMGIALTNGELLCMHGDRFMEGADTIAVNFMGEKAYLPKGPFQLIYKMKVPYTVVYAFKETFTHYHFYSTPPMQNPSSIEEAAQHFANSLEEKIKLYPYQWYNFYNFWAKPNQLKKQKNKKPQKIHE